MAPRRKKKSPPKKKASQKKRSYTEEQLDAAVNAIRSNSLSKKAASKKYGIPRTTLIDKISNKHKKSRFGPVPLLTEVEENVLVQWLKSCMRKGFPRRKLDLRMSAQKILKESGRKVNLKDCMPGPGWVRLFVGRHPDISERTPEAVTQASACVQERDIRNWFNQIEQSVLEENDLIISQIPPDRCFNADETGFQTCPKRGSVLAEKGVKNVFEVDCGKSKDMITVLFGFSAAGDIVPPSIVYPYKNAVPRDIALTVPEGFGIGHSETGWMTSEVYYDWIKHIFDPFVVSNGIEKPVVLFVDGHKSHLNYQLSSLCSSLGIILIALYPNSTRILQPADVAAFKPLKDGWKVVTGEYLTEFPGSYITRPVFAPLLKKTVDRKLSRQTLINGFRATGLHPWNPDNIKFNDRILGERNQTAYDNTLKSSKVLSCRDFEEIVKGDVLHDIKNQSVQGTHINTLRQIYSVFLEQGSSAAIFLPQPSDKISPRIPPIDQSTDRDISPINVDLNLLDALPENEYLTCEVASNNHLVFVGDSGNPNFPSTSTAAIHLPETIPSSQPTLELAGGNKKEEVAGNHDDDTGVLRLPARKVFSETTPENDSNFDSPGRKVKNLLTWPATPTRKGKRNTKRMPFFISSQKYREELEKEMTEKDNKRKALEQRKTERELKKIGKKCNKENTTSKPPAIKKSKVVKDLFQTKSTSQPKDIEPGSPGIFVPLETERDTREEEDGMIRGLCFKCGCAIGNHASDIHGFKCDICDKKFHFKCNLPLSSTDEVNLKCCDDCNSLSMELL